METRSLLSSSLGALALAVSTAAFPSASHADLLFQLTSDHCTGDCLPNGGSAGTVLLTQNGTTVDVTVTLATGFGFVETGASDEQYFKFNATGVALGDITVNQNKPGDTLAAAQSANTFCGDGTGCFSFGINNGDTSGIQLFAGPIIFHVANALIADLTSANAFGNVFVADVLSTSGATGNVDATVGTQVPGPIVGAGLPGLVMACGGLLGLARRRRQKIA